MFHIIFNLKICYFFIINNKYFQINMSKLNTHLEEMIQSSTPSIKLNLIRDYPSKEPKCLIVCHHGIMLNITFMINFQKKQMI